MTNDPAENSVATLAENAPKKDAPGSLGLAPGSAPVPPVLDACCGGRAMWFDRGDTRALFVDRRREQHLIDRGDESAQHVVIAPDVLADFTALPFADESFWHVVFDPPHCDRASPTGYLAKKYGVLLDGWEEMLRGGFAECFRVLRPQGTLIFKWSSVQIPLARVLALTPERPLYGHRSSKSMKTHWVAFFKQNSEVSQMTALPMPKSTPSRPSGHLGSDDLLGV